MEARTILTPEQIADFHEKHPPIVDQPVAADQANAIGRIGIASHRLSGYGQAEAGDKVIQVVVISHVDSRAGVDEVGNEEVRTEALAGLERTVGGIGQQTVVLQDGAQRTRSRM